MLMTLLLAAGVLVWGIVGYNLLVRDRNRVAQSWSDVGVQLARRHDLIPKLVEVVKQHAGFERSVFENVAELRARGMRETSPAVLSACRRGTGCQPRRLIAIAEAYPELKASVSYLELVKNLTDAENRIDSARRYFNGAVNDLNTRVATFPDMVPARLFKFGAAEYFEFEPGPVGS